MQLPTDWRETRDHAIKQERRQAMYFTTPPLPPSKEYNFYDLDAGSRASSLAITLVEEQLEQVDPTVSIALGPRASRYRAKTIGRSAHYPAVCAARLPAVP